MSQGKRIGVALAGCGVNDGAEIHEAVLTLLALDRASAEIVTMAPNIPQMHVIDHQAGAAITGARHIYRYAETAAPLGRNPDINEVGRSGLYLVSDLSSGVTGEVHFVDGGFNTIATPPENTE